MIGGRTIRCLLFDLGSTLWTRDGNRAALAERAAHQKAGGILKSAIENARFAALNEAALGELLYQAVDTHMRAEQRLRPGYEPDGVLAALRVLREFGLGETSQAFAGAIWEALRVRSSDSRVLFSDALSTLAALKARGYMLGVVTNRSYGGPLFREDVAAMGLLDYFEYGYMAISADLGVCKPNPEIFRYALNSLHAAPLETAMVGNSLKADIAGAKGLSLLSIWRSETAVEAEKKRAIREANIEPDVVIERLSQLLEMF